MWKYFIYHHHHHVVPQARISLALSRHNSISFITSGWFQGYIPYPHKAAVCMFELVVLLLLGHMQGSIGVHYYELVLASPAVSCMSDSSKLDSFRDGRRVAV